MIRCGYIRWEISARDETVPGDPWSRQVVFSAQPTYRTVRIKWNAQSTAEQAFVQGTATYAEVLQQTTRGVLTDDLSLPDVGPHIWKYSESDRHMLRYWFGKLQREANAFAYEVVRAASSFPQLLITNLTLRANYARMVEHEIMRVIDGKSKPQKPITEPMELDITQVQTGIPELVAAELVRDVFSPDHFMEFCHKNHVTVMSKGDVCGVKKYRIPRRTHGLIQVWDEKNKKEASLCIVFRDPGMPPSDEVVMKYLLAVHNPDELWRVANRFPAGANLPPDE